MLAVSCLQCIVMFNKATSQPIFRPFQSQNSNMGTKPTAVSVTSIILLIAENMKHGADI